MQDATPLDHQMMHLALEEARRGVAAGGMPFGAVLARGEQVLSTGHNRQIQDDDYFAHAEMVCLRRHVGGAPGPLGDTTLYATEAPCPLCAGAAAILGIRRIVIGEAHHFAGACDWLAAQGIQLVLLNQPDCIQLVSDFRDRFPDRWTRFSAG